MATSKVIVQIHERTTEVQIDADLQLRELGFISTTNVIRFNENGGTKHNVWMQDSTGVTFDNLITLSDGLMVSSGVTTITIDDDTSQPFLLTDGSKDYIDIDTTNGSEAMVIGSVTNHPNLTLYTDLVAFNAVSSMGFSIAENNNNTTFDISISSGSVDIDTVGDFGAVQTYSIASDPILRLAPTLMTCYKDLDVDGDAIIDGNVGIGTTNPDSIGHFSETTDNSATTSISNGGVQIENLDTTSGSWAQLHLKSNNQDANIRLLNTGDLQFLNDSVGLAMTIDSSGDVGIGTSIPVYTTDVLGSPTTVGATRAELFVSEDNTASTGRGGGVAFGRDTVVYGGIGVRSTASSDSNTKMTFSTRLSDVVTEQMTIDQNGNVDILNGDVTIGTDIFFDASEKRLELGDGTSTTYLLSSSPLFLISVDPTDAVASSEFRVDIDDNPVLSIDENGVINAPNLTASLMVATNGSKDLVSVAKSSAYTPTNLTTTRSYDANSTSVEELADVLGTLITDLQTANLLA